MYNYKLLNNHYLIEIDGYTFLIDTGYPFSFWISEPIRSISINNKNYPLSPRPLNFGVKETNELVGTKIDGFIGTDIISSNGLTVYKNGQLDFSIKDVDGAKLLMNKTWPLTVFTECNSITGKCIIDTGAKYGYGISELFIEQKPFDHVKDYNPHLKHFESDVYHLTATFGNVERAVDLGKNYLVEQTFDGRTIMVVNITSLFDEVCVLDTKNGLLILK